MEPFLQPEGDGEASLEEFVVHHTEFHTALASLARNKVLQLAFMMMGQIIVHHVTTNVDPASGERVDRERARRDRHGQ